MAWLRALFAPAPKAAEGGRQSPAPAVAPVERPAFPTVAELAGLLRRMGADKPDAWAAVLAPACHRHGITTPARLAAFLANILHECNNLRTLRENMNYASSALVGVFGSHRITAAEAYRLGRRPGAGPLSREQQAAIAALVYGGEWGRKNLGNIPGTSDAAMFIGRGPMQLTGRYNYERLAKATGRTVEELAGGWLETMEGGAESAAAYWAWAGCNEPADRGDITRCRRLVNGGVLGIAEVREDYAAAQAILAGNPSLA